MRLSAIVVAHLKEMLLEQCLASLDESLARVDGPVELVVVLNEASAEARDRLRRRARPVVLVEGAPALGFAGGVAAGLAVAQGEWIALVNDDCVLHPDALVELLAAADGASDVGSVAAQIRFAATDDRINSAGIDIDELGIARERGLGEPAISVGASVVEVFGASATLGLFRREMLDSLGGLDTSFFAYLEDADLAWRARAAGWRCLLAPRAVASHHHSATLGHGSKTKHLLVGRNRVRMLAKNASARQLRRSAIRILVYDALYVLYAAASDRTLAPLVGRLQGLGEWRSYRSTRDPRRREIELAPSPGILAALRRNRVYRSGGAPRSRPGQAHSLRTGPAR